MEETIKDICETNFGTAYETYRLAIKQILQSDYKMWTIT